MQRARDSERVGFSERRRNRVQSVLTIEGYVLQSIQNVEPTHPRRHGDRQRDQHPPRTAPATSDGEISTDWRARQSYAEHEMRPAGEALGVAIEKDPRQCNGSEKQT